MNKKFLIAGVLAIFLLLSICVISATDSNASDDVVKQDDSVTQDTPVTQDDSVTQDAPVKQDTPVKQDNSVKQADNPVKQKTISVKVRWDGDSSKIPGSVTVKLMRGGSVVDTAVLSPANSWSATFKVTGDGSYSVVESQNGFTASVSGNANSGFVITNKIASNEVLGAADDDNADDAGDNTADGDGQDPNSADDAANDGANNTNNTNETDDNATDDTQAPIADSTQDNNTGASNSTDTSKKSEPVTKEVVKQKVVKHTKKTPTKVNHKTGIPMVILVVAVMAAAFVPFARKKR